MGKMSDFETANQLSGSDYVPILQADGRLYDNAKTTLSSIMSYLQENLPSTDYEVAEDNLFIGGKPETPTPVTPDEPEEPVIPDEP